MIRKYQATDLEQVIAIWWEASTLAHPFLTTAFAEKVKVDMREKYLPFAETWIYEEDQQVIGFISMITNEIGGLFIQPANHSKGIGTSLVDFVGKMHPELEVEVFSENKIGKPFYEKYGFKLVKEYFDEASQQMVSRMKY